MGLSFRSHIVLFLAWLSLASCEMQTYIIHVSKPPPDHGGTHRQWHESFLPDSSRLLYSYCHVISGFAARLTPQELESVRSTSAFVHAEPSRVLNLHTTHTPSFLGLHPTPLDAWARTFNYGRGVIVGILDTGIFPNHPSFDDTGMPPPPSKWKGVCNFNLSSLCNNKLIGARSFDNGTETSSPFDVNGHGTHTAGTAAGRFVANASVLGSARGTAAGIAAEAHLAIYRVCYSTQCNNTDVMAGIDSAVADGVDVLSMSLGDVVYPFYNDSIAIAALGAVRKGVFFAASAGNDGPFEATVQNTAPWMLTVGASTMDRRIRAVVKLGNGIELEGESAYQPIGFNSNHDLSLVYPQSPEDDKAGYWRNQTTLERIGIKGKIVLCVNDDIDAVEKSKLVKGAGAAAMILTNPNSRGYDTYVYPHFLPASCVAYNDGLTIVDYIKNASNPTARIEFKGTAIGGPSDPAVAAFSSRGPSPVNPGILKPDIIGPGVNVLAAWPEPVGPFPVNPPFNILQGTSMSCPHLAGVAALLKSAHPDWSPAMIKSAIMTTAEIDNLSGRPIIDMMQKTQASVNDIGAGHVNPVKANNPGLVYDICFDDYISYLCGLNYTNAQVSLVAHEKIDCENHPIVDESNLNYPAFVVSLRECANSTCEVIRTVTNVGGAGASYDAKVDRPFAVSMVVIPRRLEFKTIGEKQKYTIRFGINHTEAAQVKEIRRTEGLFSWVSSDGKVVVRSPLLVKMGWRNSSQPLTVGRSNKYSLH